MKRAVCLLVPLGTALSSYLAVSRPQAPTKWGFPGGKVDAGEHEFEAVLRELREEVGLDVPADEVVPLYCDVCPGKGRDDTYWVTTYLWLREPGPLTQPVTPEAGLSFGWKSEAELTDPQHSPFARYNVGVFAALRRHYIAGG